MPIFLIVLAAVILLLLALLFLRVRVLLLCTDTVKLQLRILCFRLTLFPKKPPSPHSFSPEALRKKERKAKRKAAKKAAKAAKKQNAKERRTTKETGAKSAHTGDMELCEKLELIQKLLVALLRATDKHLRLRAARLHIRVATGDAAKTAVLYGAVSGALSGVLALLDRVTVLRAKPPEVAVYADYLSEHSRADIRLVFSMRLGGALLSLFSVAMAFFRTRRAQKRKKAEASEEKKAPACHECKV